MDMKFCSMVDLGTLVMFSGMGKRNRKSETESQRRRCASGNTCKESPLEIRESVKEACSSKNTPEI